MGPSNAHPPMATTAAMTRTPRRHPASGWVDGRLTRADGIAGCRPSASTGAPTSLDDLVGSQEHRRRQREPERPGRLQVDGEVVAAGPLDGEAAGGGGPPPPPL